MSLPLTDEEVRNIYGSLDRVLYDCPAARMRVIAGDAGWDVGLIPDGINESGGIQRPPIASAIDGQWANWATDLKAQRLRNLAQALRDFLAPMGSGDKVNAAILKHGYCFVNGDFVPVDANGNIPS